MVPCKFSLILSLFGLRPSFKGHGSNLWFSTNTIILLYILTLDLRLTFKVALSYFEGTKNEEIVFFTLKMKDYIHKSWSQYYKGIGIPIWRFTPKYVRNMCKVRKICDYGIHGTSSKVGLKNNFISKKIGYITLNKV